MSSTTLPNYLSTAFYSQYNLILLGGATLFSLASASPLPLIAGLGAETLWLIVGPRLPAFRRHVDQRADSERRAELDEQVSQGMRGMDPEHGARVQAVGNNVSWILLRHEAAARSAPERAALAELEQLRPTYLPLCRVHERLRQQLNELRLAPPELEVAQLSARYSAEKDLGLRFTLHQAIKSAQRKIEQQTRLNDLYRQVELKLSLIEQSLVQLRNQGQLGGPSGDWVRDLQGVLGHATGVTEIEKAFGELQS
jgi:hypothetical protein